MAMLVARRPDPALPDPAPLARALPGPALPVARARVAVVAPVAAGSVVGSAVVAGAALRRRRPAPSAKKFARPGR